MPGTYTSLHYHVVFSTQGRRRVITENLLPRLHAYLGGIVNELGGACLAVGGIGDHVHMLIGLPAVRAISDVVRIVKTNSSKWIHEQIGQLDFAWQSGYSAFTVSASQLERVREYVNGQAEHHKSQSFDDEIIALLQRHGIQYDPRYVLDGWVPPVRG